MENSEKNIQPINQIESLRECPFCGEEVEYYEDDYGGSWVEHKIKHVDGKKDPCILTKVQVDYSAEQGKDWNHRAVCKSKGVSADD